MRKRHILQWVLNPKSRPRHEVIDVKHYMVQRNSKYVDFYEERGDVSQVAGGHPWIQTRTIVSFP